MSSYFGPEIPTPSCVVTEKHLNGVIDDMFEDNKTRHEIKELKCEYNETDADNLLNYEKTFTAIINKYLDIDCNDDILFIKPYDTENSWSHYDYTSQLQNWPKIIERKFCLLKPLDICDVKLVENIKKNTDELYPSEEEAKFELIFSGQQKKLKKYDKIIIKNSLKYFEESQKIFLESIMNLFKNQIQTKTNILIIQRCSDLNTLPFEQKVNNEWKLNDLKYSKFMKSMQNEFFAIKFDFENLKYTIDCKTTWYQNIKDTVIYPVIKRSPIVTQVSNGQRSLLNGIRELNEGVFKYQEIQKYVELNDRLLFIGAHGMCNKQMVMAERIKMINKKQKDSEVDEELKKLSLEITADLQPLVKSFNFR